MTTESWGKWVGDEKWEKKAMEIPTDFFLEIVKNYTDWGLPTFRYICMRWEDNKKKNKRI